MASNWRSQLTVRFQLAKFRLTSIFATQAMNDLQGAALDPKVDIEPRNPRGG